MVITPKQARQTAGLETTTAFDIIKQFEKHFFFEVVWLLKNILFVMPLNLTELRYRSNVFPIC